VAQTTTTRDHRTESGRASGRKEASPSCQRRSNLSSQREYKGPRQIETPGFQCRSSPEQTVVSIEVFPEVCPTRPATAAERSKPFQLPCYASAVAVERRPGTAYNPSRKCRSRNRVALGRYHERALAGCRSAGRRNPALFNPLSPDYIGIPTLPMSACARSIRCI